MAQNVDVICFQELNDKWRAEFDKILVGWTRASCSVMTTSTYVKAGLVILQQAEHQLLPDADGKRVNRYILQTVIGRSRSCTIAEQQTWNVWNNHTVSGQKDWKINGDIGTFCKLTLRLELFPEGWFWHISASSVWAKYGFQRRAP